MRLVGWYRCVGWIVVGVSMTLASAGCAPKTDAGGKGGAAKGKAADEKLAAPAFSDSKGKGK